LDTVYRTLWLLGDLDLIRTLGPLRERARFEANLKGHHHFVCVKCGLTRDFESEDLGTLPIPASAKKFGQVEAIQIEARGICRKCASKKKSRRTSSKKRRYHD
jgi:Fur family peroxide stress response transcriptional regulator